jgi:transposase-like protein
LEEDPDFLPEAVRVMSEFLLEVAVSQQIGAQRSERKDERASSRNRERTWATRVGEMPLRIPKRRPGSYSPSLLEPRRRAGQALLAVIQQADVQGVSVRRVDDLLKALGLTGIDKRALSRIGQQLDDVVQQFRQRPLEGSYP